MTGHATGEIIGHLIKSNVNQEDYDDEIIRIEEGMQTVFDPSERPQVHYTTKLQTGWIMTRLQTGWIRLLQLKVLCDGKNHYPNDNEPLPKTYSRSQ